MDEVPERTEVTIIGAGPAGLVAAMLLGKAGVEVEVLERRSSLSDLPRAHLLNLRTMEIFRELGIADDVYDLSPPEDRWHRVAWRTSLSGERPQQGRLIGSVDAWGGGVDRERYGAASPTAFANVPQMRLDPLMREHAGRQLPGRIHYGYEATSIDQDGTGAVVTFTTPGGGTETIRSRFVVAGDGGRFVPAHLGVEMVGRQGFLSQVSTRFAADLSPFIEEDDVLLHYFIDPKGKGSFRGALCALGPDDWGRKSTEWVLHQGFAIDDRGAQDDDVVIDGVRDILGLPDLELNVQGIMRWTFEGVVAERYRVQNVFLVGNSAHRHPPTGGLGLNTAVQDAHNLAWKLAAVFREGAGDALLDSYESERKPIGQFNVDHSLTNSAAHAKIAQALGLSANQDLESGWNEIDLWMSDTAEGAARRRSVDAAVQANKDDYGQLNVEVGFAYHEGALISDGTEPPATHGSLREYTPSARPGHHLPHAWVDDAESRSTLDLIEHMGFTLLVAESRADEWSGVEGIGNVVVKSVADVRWETVAGVGVGGAVLVRPDRHVAWRAAETPTDATGVVRDIVATLYGLESDAGPY